jgi:hypothetical protein
MNLQENIDRIQSMMGVINENALQSKVNNMIDKIGLYGTIKFFGEPLKFVNTYLDINSISKENKIQFIEEVVDKFLGETEIDGISLFQYEESPILYYEDKHVIKLIEHVYKNVVTVDSYHKPSDSYMDSEDIPYEKLNDETLNEIFYFLLDII